MDTQNAAPSRLLPVVKVALLCACASLALALVNERLCVLPLAVFLSGACLAAPFFPRIRIFSARHQPRMHGQKHGCPDI